MKIKEIADKLNISPRAIRFYEEKGLITPAKQAHNQYRTYTDKDAWRLQTIISLREVGMSLDDIKRALAQLDVDDGDELRYYLELQRAVIFSQWLELKQIIHTTDHMIELIKQNKLLAIEDIYQLAGGSRRLRELRKNWHDRWNFDQKAVTHDEQVLNQQPPSPFYRDYEAALETIVQFIDPKKGERGLDIGAGTGNLGGKFIAKGTDMAAVDQSKAMLKECQRKFPQLETKLGNLLAIPYLDRQFDFVVTSFALHHVTAEQQQLALEEMHRVLHPHGRICIADLMFKDQQSRLRYLYDLIDSGQEDLVASIEGEHFSLLSELLPWFSANGYIIKHRQLNELLHIVFAVPNQSKSCYEASSPSDHQA